MGNRKLPERSTLRRPSQLAFAKTPTTPPPNDFADDAAAAATMVSNNPTARVRMATVAMTGAPGTPPDLGQPPAMPAPRSPLPARVVTDTGFLIPEDPTHMPHPRDLPTGVPTDPAQPPGIVPSGDSRSLRQGATFILVYRLGTYVITRTGDVGQRGVWRVVEYPTMLAASGAYARESSRWVDNGFVDFRG
jgi:hypothetical protein